MIDRDRKRLRRLALEIAILLPDDRDEALKVLKYSEELVSEFLEEAAQDKRCPDVISLVHITPPGS